jgi:alginate O-acetyltransferase complex protein AlgI
MLFNSIQFLSFYIVVLFLFFTLPQRFRWILLLVASLYFYMCWRPAYVVFLLFVIVVDYSVGIALDKSQDVTIRRLLLGVSLFANLGLLFTFKYFNFFSHTVQSLVQHKMPTLALVLPIGISFHVFQSLGYTIDVYRRKQKAEHRLGIFAVFVSFFPQLVAGPIERPQNLLGQFDRHHQLRYENVRSGCLLALWGLIKKLCIADLMAPAVNKIYASPESHAGPILFLGTVFFAIQIYCDFSGYTDIARGVARIMGFELMLNFRRPYFALSIKEFWQRWHISLSTWFRDYVYFPLGGSRVESWRNAWNLMVVFVVSGLWHGSAWTYVLWGVLHGMYLAFGTLTRDARNAIIRKAHVSGTHLLSAAQWLLTMNFVLVGWVFFRASSVTNAFYIVSHMYRPARLHMHDVMYGLGLPRLETMIAFFMTAVLFIVDYILEKQPAFVLARLWTLRPLRWTVYVTAIYALIVFGVWEKVQFIYFQF